MMCVPERINRNANGSFLHGLTFALLLVAVALLGAAIATAETCDKDLTPVRDPDTKYQSRSASLCEGYYKADVSTGGRLRIAGLTHGPLAYPLVEGTVVLLDCPFLQNDHAHVQGVGIPMGMYYRIDAEIAAGESISWNLDNVVFPKQIPSYDVGLLAWLDDGEGEDGEVVFLPVRATVAGAEDTDDPPDLFPISICVRAAVDVESVVWRAADVEEDGSSNMGQWIRHEEQGTFSGGWPIYIELLSSESRLMRVEVAARRQGTTEWLTLDFILLCSEDSDASGNE